MATAALEEALLDALPQTQCRRCGYADCRGYAEALAAGETEVNRCPPGGAAGVERLARLLERPVLPIDPECGHEAPRALAVIDEAECIGCALCLSACPVEAIIGAAKKMHTVVDACCTGCELCIPVCPVDCISLVAASGERTGWSAWSPGQAGEARERYARHRARIDTSAAEVGASATGPANGDGNAASRRDVVAAALARARSARAAR